MRIFYAAGATPNSDLKSSNIWYYNLYLPLQDLRHEIIEFKFDLQPYYDNADPENPEKRAFIDANRPRLENELLKQIRIAHQIQPIDLFFSYFYSSFVNPVVIEEISKMGILTVNWYCNASYQFHLVEKIAPAYDYCLVPEKFRLEDYSRVGAHPIYCQEAANPKFYKSYDLPIDYDVTFVGAQYSDRAEIVSYLLKQGIKVNVWGPSWKSLCPPMNFLRRPRWLAARYKHYLLHQPIKPILPGKNCGDQLSDIEMVKMYSRSKISLGFSNVGETHHHGKPIKQIRLRDFEAPMSGAFYMVEYMEELEEFFDIGKEVICYSNKIDLAQKIKYYLKHEKEREQIRQAGHTRAVRDHTWQKRFQESFRQMGLAQ